MSLRPTVAGVQRLFAGLAVSSTARTSLHLSTRRFLTSTTSSSLLASSSPTFQLWKASATTTLNALQRREFSTKDGNENDRSSSEDKQSSSSSAANQHQGWVDFQKSIAVEGFETGQMKETKKKSTRGGRNLSKRKSKEALKLEERIAERQRLTDIGGGEYPPLRYSDAETERLLAQAYAAIPARGGKRGTRNKKRQEKRWWLVRKIHKKYKKNMLKYQERKMAERSRRVKAVKAVLAEAPEINSKDRAYQMEVFARWTATMYPDKV